MDKSYNSNNLLGLIIGENMNISKIKEAQTKYHLIDLIKNRWSPRAFSDKKVTKESLGQIFESARWAASCANGQPWRFILGIKGENDSYDKITSSLDEGNKIWTKSAPVLVVLVAKKTYDNGSINAWNEYDLGQAAANMATQALSEDLYVHQMAGFNPEILIKEFNIPDDFTAKTVMAIGYLGDIEVLNEKLKEREIAKRSRKDLEELVFSNNWNEKFF